MTEAIINQPWEDVADDVTSAIEKAVQPLLKKAVNDIYGGLLDATQDYLKDNLAFNIASRISAANIEASYFRRKVERLEAINAELLEGMHRLYRRYIKTLENERARIQMLGGDCDPVDRMEEGDPVLIAARAAIASAQRIIGEGE